MEIEKGTIHDIEKLKAIAERTFVETYASKNSEENLSEYLKKAFSIDKLKSQLNDKNSEFYFAKYEKKTIGYLKVNTGTSQTNFKSKNGLEIERIYVLKEFYGKKVGQIFCDKAIKLAKEKNTDYVWLSVWEQNPRAIRFYEKNGFIADDNLIFKLGNDRQIGIMMKLYLNKKSVANT
ncbi:GNAT family N-acetyltransferase [Lutibacter sp. A80]|uniref:GNAT family N-acetyltransferase n=1 Tax=Lutibacter sp. A80 TaxID=2918453 RepID=UPI001F05FAD9|nr:GNAT family N-acetyltransferase [Lutibacter sp. A80]UMB61163.1 GNAT family N-acetyltransferase [Lutibacter sp. A80]